MEPLTAIIVDDEELARENLRMLLDDLCPEIEVIGLADGVNKGKAMIREMKPQVVFLDIRMPSGSEGFELLSDLQDMEFMVIFVTAFKDYAVRAFNARAIHYVLKPIDIDDLRHAIEKLLETKANIERSPEGFSGYMKVLESLTENLADSSFSKRIAISHTKGFKIVNDQDIIRLEAEGNCTRIYFKDGTTYLDTRTLRIYEDTLLDTDRFLRIHKSHIVNMGQLSEYLHENGHIAVMKNGDRIPVARMRLKRFVNQIKAM